MQYAVLRSCSALSHLQIVSLGHTRLLLTPAKHSNPSNPLVILNLDIGGERDGLIALKLLADIMLKTAEIFHALCTGKLCTEY